MTHLDELEQKSIFIIREAYSKFGKIGLLWSIGKDSTTLLWLIRKAFYGKIPFPVVHIDTTYKFPQMYQFRDRYAEKWNLNLIIAKNEEALAQGISYDSHDAFTCCNELKTKALKKIVDQEGFEAVFVGIRRDEHGIRNKEHFFSPRDNDFRWQVARQKTIEEKKAEEIREEKGESVVGDSDLISLQDPELDGIGVYATEFVLGTSHVRVHPLLHWTELDIWQYIEREGIPVCELYFAKGDKESEEGEAGKESKGRKRYRSLGCMPITSPVSSRADTVGKIIEELKTTDVSERSGRLQDKEDEYTMQKLRSLGYM